MYCLWVGEQAAGGLCEGVLAQFWTIGYWNRRKAQGLRRREVIEMNLTPYALHLVPVFLSMSPFVRR